MQGRVDRQASPGRARWNATRTKSEIGTTSASRASRTASRCCSPTGSGATRTCGGSSRPRFEDRFRVVLFDHVGAGGSDLVGLRPRALRRRSHGYADDVLEICRGARPARRGLRRPLGVGDDRRARRDRRARSRFAKLVMVGPVAPLHRRRRLRRRLHRGRHRRAARLARQQLPRVVERDGAGDHGQRRPARARRGAHRELLPHRPGDRPPVRPRSPSCSDNRADLAKVTVPTLVLQCTDDVIAPVAVGEYVRDTLPRQRRWCCSTPPATARTSARRTPTTDAIAAFVRA